MNQNQMVQNQPPTAHMIIMDYNDLEKFEGPIMSKQNSCLGSSFLIIIIKSYLV